MNAPVLLAAVGCVDLEAAYATARTRGLAVFGTMDGIKLAKLKAAVPAADPVTVYLYTPT